MIIRSYLILKLIHPYHQTLIRWHQNNCMLVSVLVRLAYVHDDVIKWNIFRITGHLCEEFTGHRRFPCTKTSEAELWCFFICAWTYGWVNNREAGDLRRHRAHYDVIVMYSVKCMCYLRLENKAIVVSIMLACTVCDIGETWALNSEGWVFERPLCRCSEDKIIVKSRSDVTWPVPKIGGNTTVCPTDGSH